MEISKKDKVDLKGFASLTQNLEKLEKIIIKLEGLLEKMILEHEEEVTVDWLPKKYKLSSRDPYNYNNLQVLKKKLIKKYKSGLKLKELGDLKAKLKESFLKLKWSSDRKTIDGIKVGRSARGNFDLFKGVKLIERQKGSKHVYLHSSVRGGSLVVLDSNCDELSLQKACTLALAYSKNYRTLNTSSGYVDISTQVTEGPALGSFYFKDSKTVYHYPLNLYIHLEPTVKVSFQPSSLRIIAGGSREVLRNHLRKLSFNNLKLSPQAIAEIQARLPQDWSIIEEN